MLRRSSFSPLEQTRSVSGVFVHPQYDPYHLHNDITLLLVQEPFDLNQWSSPACLPPPDFNPPIGTNCTVIGWGDVIEEGPDCKKLISFLTKPSEITFLFLFIADVLREVVLPLTSCSMETPINRSAILCAGRELNLYFYNSIYLISISKIFSS